MIGRLFRRQWQREVEGGAAAQFAFCPDASAVGQDDVLDDGQTEAGAARLARARFINAIEALEDAGEVFAGDAGAEVADGELDLGGDLALIVRDEQPCAGDDALAGLAILECCLLYTSRCV